MAVVAIAREIGTAGTQVGQALSRRLGCPLLTREIVLEAARRYDVAPDKLADVDEHAPSFWQRFDRERRRHLVFLRAALLDRIAGGACIVIGRVAPLLLLDVPPVLRARITAPRAVRVRRLMAENGIEEAAAQGQIDAYERELEAQAQALFGLDWREPTHYDVVLSTGRLGIEECAAVLARSTDTATHRPTPATRACLRDHAVAACVHAALARERGLGALGVTVRAADGHVTITAATIGPAFAERVRGIAARVEGVREVTCVSEAPVPIPPVERL
ncbi:MAG TPA: cytidylate kinase-like family protein [Candidatus Binatia bacterium]|nr:cytidylate kinase-like family protein [Candidatus Binatia bacterium]